jgi:drug/metabolite transporter (DMT)-like permease
LKVPIEVSESSGIIAALTAAFVWTIASVLYRRLGATIPPMVLNLYKGCIGTALFLITLAALGQFEMIVAWHPAIPALLISGVIGIGIGDTAYFMGLNRLGEQKTLLISQTLAPVFAAVMAAIWLSEILSGYGYVGIAMTLAGIGVVIFERVESHADRDHLRVGIAASAVAAACQATGIVITRDVFLEEELHSFSDVSIFAAWTALLRIFAGAITLLPLIPLFNLLFPKRKQTFAVRGFTSRKIWLPMVIAITFGTFIGIFLQQFALYSAEAALAQTLFAFSSIWALGFQWFGPKRPSAKAFLGAGIAIAGIAVVLTTG